MPPTSADTTCPRCGASIAVPETGLNMVCQYCNHQAPVPDVEQRRKAMEREAAHRRHLEASEQKERHRREREQQKKVEREREERHNQHGRVKRAHRQRWAARLATIPGCLLTIFITAVVLVAPAIGLFEAGMLDAFVGGGGSTAHSAAQKALLSSGYTLAAKPQQVRLLGDSGDLPTVELRSDLCYAFAAGSEALITSMNLSGPTGSNVASRSERAYGQVLTHCPESTGIHQLQVQLDQQFGRYTWSWAWKAKAGSTNSSQTVPRAPRFNTRRSSRNR